MMKPKRISIVAVVVTMLVALFAVGMAGTAETKEPNEWLAQARQQLAGVQVIDWETVSDDEKDFESKEIDGVMMYSLFSKETWKTYEELLADKEDGYYVPPYEDAKKYYEAEIAHTQALADHGAHFWMLDKGWVQDPQEAMQTLREECRQFLEENRNGRKFLYGKVPEGQTEDDWNTFERVYREVHQTDTNVVIQFAPAMFLFYDYATTQNELRDYLLELCMDCVYYDLMTPKQADDILSADFLY